MYMKTSILYFYATFHCDFLPTSVIKIFVLKQSFLYLFTYFSSCMFIVYEMLNVCILMLIYMKYEFYY